MGRLAGYSYRELTKRLHRLGFVFDRSARARTTIPRHAGDLPEGTVRAILNQAAISVDDFLGQR